MTSPCPGRCATGNQRPLDFREFTQMSPKARAEITLLKKTAVLCELCGCVYVGSGAETVYLERLPVAGQ
jgi:hypothetical protein